jgi:hypothetical protein
VRKRARRREAVMEITNSLQLAARVLIFILAFLFHAAVSEQDVGALAEGNEERDELRVVQLEEGRVNVPFRSIRVRQQCNEFLTQRAPKKIADGIPRRGNALDQLPPFAVVSLAGSGSDGSSLASH